jgi:FAD/FMN-containing dehydrogenase
MNPVPNYKRDENFSNESFNQTDFGRLFFNQPKEILTPKTTEELAQILKQCNKEGKQVKIRNTGHSVNGQTLTSGTQVSVSELKSVKFDRERLEVNCGVGSSWDAVLKGISFPEFCLPIFPNNPKQAIHIGGTIAVGGVGSYSSLSGGCWNYVQTMKVVTMEGEIIECSKDVNSDIFKYSVAGFGRIGVIAEITLKVERSAYNVLSIALLYKDFERYYSDLQTLHTNPLINGMFGITHVQKNDIVSAITPFTINLSHDLKDGEFEEDIFHQIKQLFNEDVTLVIRKDPTAMEGVDIGLNLQSLPKERLVYYYPGEHSTNGLEMIHPWSDFIIPPSKYPDFIRESYKVIKENDIGKYIVSQLFFNNLVNIEVYITYVIRKIANTPDEFMPLSLDLQNEDFVFMPSIMPNLPVNKIDSAMNVIKELTDLTFELGGKRYLYGIHNLSKEQIEKQYGGAVIQKWNTLKNKLDPRHLLNIGVIEHLDNF